MNQTSDSRSFVRVSGTQALKGLPHKSSFLSSFHQPGSLKGKYIGFEVDCTDFTFNYKINYFLKL